MEGSMSLKKRAIEGIVVAGSLVMMSTIAQAADLDGVQVRNAAVQAATDFCSRPKQQRHSRQMLSRA